VACTHGKRKHPIHEVATEGNWYDTAHRLGVTPFAVFYPWTGAPRSCPYFSFFFSFSFSSFFFNIFIFSSFRS
jgi:hypothetical protein